MFNPLENKIRGNYPLSINGFRGSVYDYEAEKLRKRKESRIRKNKRNARGRAQTQGAALGAVSNILGG
jgi:hypothetical protein